jgi:hypothetical protein
MSLLKSLLSGQAERVAPAKVESDVLDYTDEQKKKITEAAAGVKKEVNEQLDPDRLKTAASGVSALGDTLMAQSAQTRLDPAAMTIDRTAVGPAPTRAVTDLDVSQIRDVGTLNLANVPAATFDEASIRRGQAYTGGEGEQYQRNLMQTLSQQAAGQGPSVAQLQFNAANEANLAASLAQQASLRGGYDPAAARQIRQTAADLQAKAASDAAQARMQEQLNAQNALANVAGTVEQQAGAKGSQSIQAQQADTSISQAKAQTETAAADLALRGETAAIEAQLRAREQDTAIQTTIAELKDGAAQQQFEGQLETILKQADIDSVESRTQFSEQVGVAVRNMELDQDVLAAVYSGNRQAFMSDVEAYNEMIKENARANISVAQSLANLEKMFIDQGMAAESAKIRAKNINDAAMVAHKQANKDRDIAAIRGGISLAAQGAAMYASGGLSGLAGGGGGTTSTPLAPLTPDANFVPPSSRTTQAV